ncbi:MAG: hypothetical protein PHP45_04725 [Elusimicrobiales bacterium]|nr:hypothetical protein [Elusimicrobiales bacterium]
MKTLDPASQNAFNSPKPKYFKRVYLYRRAWNGSAFAYDAAIDLTPDVAEVGKIQIKLDTEKFNKWTFSNCTVTVRNDKQQWNPGNPDGYFPSGKQVFNSRVQIIAGVVRLDGTQDPQYVYTGYLSAPPTQYPDAKTIQLSVQDHLSIFDQRMADGTGGDAPVGTVAVNEVVGQNSGNEFTTAHVGAGIITTVLKGTTSGGPQNATPLNPNLDYNTSNLNMHDVGATITLNAPLVSGQSLWVTYTYWHLDKPLEWVVAQICALCGIMSTNISPAIFSNSIKNTFAQLTENDFNLGTYDNTFYYWVGCVTPNLTMGYPSSGTYVSPVIDGTAAFRHWGQFSASFSNPTGSTSIFYWRESADGVAWGEWTVITSGQICPATKRYLQLKWYAWEQNSAVYRTTLTSWQIDYYYSSTTIPVVDMTGLSCMGALAALAEMCCYEIGFDSTDTFIFRPRSDGSAPVRMLANADIASLDSLTTGADRVYTQVVVNFGDYTAVVNSRTQSEPPPNAIDIFGTLQYEVDSGNFLPDNTANLAQAIALTVYQYVKGARRRLRLKTRFFLDLELGDKVQLKYIPLDFLTTWVWGDARVRYGNRRFVWYGANWLMALLPLYLVIFRVEGIELDLENWNTVFDLTEAI